MPAGVEIAAVSGVATWDLRRRVLRGGRADAKVTFAGDDDPTSFHLGAYVSTRTQLGLGEASGSACGPGLAGVLSVLPESVLPESLHVAESGLQMGAKGPSFRLRGMAVDPAWQGRKVGTALWRAAAGELRNRGAELCWANARDSALPFYAHLGWRVVGEGFTGEQGVPHHLVVIELN
ncbi:MAG: GNAT family N-acetyltransferase [Actinomycetota bacterium]|nr:GNAT family N-acetyltransferase [Actinomycetota bacterium]